MGGGYILKKLPKTCLTCAFMNFEDDELELLQCFHIKRDCAIMVDDYVCENYELNKSVQQDADQVCWE